MIRTFAHLLLILVVLACPVQCVIGGDSCCASKTSEPDAASERTYSSTNDCCHHAGKEGQASKSTDELPTHVPQSDDNCNCDCLCKGAIASASLIAEDFGTPLLHAVVDSSVTDTIVSGSSETPQADPPDALSGREIRTLRMSFQV